MRNAYSKHTVKDATVTITDGTYEYVLEVPEVELMLYSVGDDPYPLSHTLFTHFEGEASMLTCRKLKDEEDGRDESAAYFAEIASHDAQAAALSYSDGMTHIQWDCGVECYVSYSPRRYPEEFEMLHAGAHGRAEKP